MVIMKKLSLVFLIILFSLFLVSNIFSSNYGGCRYGYGLYGLGEDCGSGASGGSSGGGGSGGGGSGGTATATTQAAGTVNVETPDDLGDGISSSFEFACGSECQTSVNEISTDTFLSETKMTASSGEELLGAVKLECSGDVSTATASVSVEVSDDVGCDNLRVDFVNDDGTIESTDLNSCSKSGSTVSVSVSHSGCSYLAVWKTVGKKEAEVQPTVTVPVEETPKIEEESVAQAVGTKKTGLLYLLLGVVVVLVIVFFVLKKKKK